MNRTAALCLLSTLLLVASHGLTQAQRASSKKSSPPRRNPAIKSPPPRVWAPPPPSCPTLTSGFQRQNLTVAAALASACGLQGVVSNTKTALTLFVPTNQAFDALFGQFGIGLAELLAEHRALVCATFLGHIIADKHVSKNLDSSAVVESVVPDVYMYIYRDPTGIFVQGAYGNAKVLRADIQCARSAIHIIDDVLLLTKDGASGDVFPTISDALASRDDLSGMSLLLDVVRSLVGDAVNDPAAAYTVFAPSSDALAAFLVSSNTTLEDLKRNPGSAMSLMGLHLVPGTRLLSSMAMEGQDYVLGTMAADKISLRVNATGVFVSGPFNTAKVVQKDVLAGLATIHVIDSVVIAS